MEVIILEDIKKIIATLSPVHCDFLSENCIVALENNSHNTGCKLVVSGERSINYLLSWQKLVTKSGYQEPRDYIKNAAEGISFLLIRKLTPFTVFEQARIGTGVDYWLSKEDEDMSPTDHKNFIVARIEISGIERENTFNLLTSRVNIKKTQTIRSNDTRLPAYVSVVEFSTPKAYFSKIS